MFSKCAESYNKIVEWVESDIIMRKLTNMDISSTSCWAKHEKRGDIRHGNLTILIRKYYFILILCVYKEENLDIANRILRQCNIQHEIEYQLFNINQIRTEKIMFNQLNVIVELLKFA